MIFRASFQMQQKTSGLLVGNIKIGLPINQDLVDIAGAGIEGVWAEKIEDDVYLIQNTPLFSHGFSFGDKVYVRDTKDIVSTDDVISPSETSTLLVVSCNAEHLEQTQETAGKHNCAFESAAQKLCTAISVARDTDLKSIHADVMDLEEVQRSWVLVISQRHYSGAGFDI